MSDVQTSAVQARIAEREGARARLVQRAEEIDFDWIEGVKILGITAGASAPEVLVREVVAQLATRYAISEREITTTVERMSFKLPHGLAA